MEPLLEFTMIERYRTFGYQPYKVGRTLIIPYHVSFIMQKHKAWQFEVRQTLNRLFEGGM